MCINVPDKITTKLITRKQVQFDSVLYYTYHVWFDLHFTENPDGIRDVPLCIVAVQAYSTCRKYRKNYKIEWHNRLEHVYAKMTKNNSIILNF